MKFACPCGATIHDAGDAQPGKAHIIPDRSFFPLMDALDELVLKRCATATQREAACTHMRSLIVKATRHAWQCAACGRLHFDDAARTLNTYAPEEGASKSIFS
jgi:hypothetical protein